jgi:hypothetical protein
VSTLAGADARAKLMIAKGHERRDFTRQPSIETAGALRRRFAIESSDKPRPNEHSIPPTYTPRSRSPGARSAGNMVCRGSTRYIGRPLMSPHRICWNVLRNRFLEMKWRYQGTAFFRAVALDTLVMIICRFGWDYRRDHCVLGGPNSEAWTLLFVLCGFWFLEGRKKPKTAVQSVE